MTSLMLDLETLSTEMNAVVLSLGAQLFNNDGLIGEGFEVFFSIDEQIAMGRHISTDTLSWWLVQSKVARETISLGLSEASETAYYALCSLHAYLEESVCALEDLKIWSNGASFDIPILTSLYSDINKRFSSELANLGWRAPWEYYNHHCYRTLIKLANVTKSYTITHSALQDSKDQALLAIEAANKLGLTL